MPGSPHPDRPTRPGGDRGGLTRVLNDCVAAVGSAKEGQRHPTYLQQSARARAICDKHGIEWPEWRDALQGAYEATLTAAEIRERQRGSIEGVPGWLDRRVP